MHKLQGQVTRRDFLKGATYAALATTLGLPAAAVGEDQTAQTGAKKVRVILIRDQAAITQSGKYNAEVIKPMLDQAVCRLQDQPSPAQAWKSLFKPEDIVGIKSNVWGPLPTPAEVENAIKLGLLSAGVSEKNIAVDDRDVLDNAVFQKATALVNTRPMRSHHWSGISGVLKNHIMFSPTPWAYHDNSCADLAKLWELPLVNGKTRLNVLVMMTPLFHGVGAHHFDPQYTWPYKGLLVSADPVAVDSIGLEIINARRRIFLKEERPITPPPHHIVFADTRHHLGTADRNKIELIKIGWQDEILI